MSRPAGAGPRGNIAWYYTAWKADLAAMRTPLFNRAIFLLSLVGLIVASYLWKMHAHPADIPCGGSGGCEVVANSPYSRFPAGSGPPVAAYGAIGYAAILLLSFLRSLFQQDQRRDHGRTLLALTVAGAVFGAVASLYLTYMEINPNYIGAICRWCMTSLALILLILTLAVTELVMSRRRSGSPAASRETR
jgi:uncharacterized membrane protein